MRSVLPVNNQYVTEEIRAMQEEVKQLEAKINKTIKENMAGNKKFFDKFKPDEKYLDDVMDDSGYSENSENSENSESPSNDTSDSEPSSGQGQEHATDTDFDVASKGKKRKSPPFAEMIEEALLHHKGGVNPERATRRASWLSSEGQAMDI